MNTTFTITLIFKLYLWNHTTGSQEYFQTATPFPSLSLITGKKFPPNPTLLNLRICCSYSFSLTNLSFSLVVHTLPYPGGSDPELL